MERRKHISYKTKYAAELLRRGDVPYEHAKQMTEDQVVSLYQTDHNILHESGHPDRDKFWNLTNRLISEHREKTKQDAKIIAKGRRIRMQGPHLILTPEARQELRDGNPVEVLREVYSAGRLQGEQAVNTAWLEEAYRPGGAIKWNLGRKLRSRGFDKTLRKKMDGTVVKR